MDRLCVTLTALIGVVSSSLNGTSEPLEELRVRPGDNITLYCDCQIQNGFYIVWFRNCSHENQPPLVILTLYKSHYGVENPFSRLKPHWNKPNNTWDLQIENVTESDLGLYYCGTEETKVEDKKTIYSEKIFKYGNIVRRLSFVPPRCISTESGQTDPHCRLCCMLLFTVCPACILLSSLISSILVYRFCKKTVSKPSHAQHVTKSSRDSENRRQDEDGLCYAALDILQAPKRPMTRKRPEASDFSTYSVVSFNTGRV